MQTAKEIQMERLFAALDFRLMTMERDNAYPLEVHALVMLISTVVTDITAARDSAKLIWKPAHGVLLVMILLVLQVSSAVRLKQVIFRSLTTMGAPATSIPALLT